MHYRMRIYVYGGFTVALLILITGPIASLLAHTYYVRQAKKLTELATIANSYEEVLSYLKDIETARRGFALTEDPSYLQPYDTALPLIESRLNLLEKIASDNPQVAKELDALRPTVSERIASATESIEDIRRQGYVKEVQAPIGTAGRAAMDRARATIGTYVSSYNDNTTALRAHILEVSAWVGYAMLVGTLVSLVMVAAVFVLLRREAVSRGKLEQAHARTNEALAQTVSHLRKQREDVALVAEMGELMLTSVSLDEAFRIVEQFFPRLFPNSHGGLYFTSPSRDMLEQVAKWGADGVALQTFDPSACWAMRRGRIHQVEQGSQMIPCDHVKDHSLALNLCIPMMAQGEAQGVLWLGYSNGQALAADEIQFLQNCAEQVALGVTNIRLRETLRTQATRDPLTGLFNRRYMQETLEREIARSKRDQEPVAVLLTDIDHFKHFNDTHGHAAGDLVIRELGRFLQTYVRGSDVACRYGGEEFTLIFPGASKAITLERAEKMVREVKELQLRYEGAPLGTITLSIGVAAFPADGSTAASLLKSADTALYKAKQNGRDQVVSAEGNFGLSPAPGR